MIQQNEYLGCDRQKTNNGGLILEMANLGRDCQQNSKRRMILQIAYLAPIKKLNSAEQLCN